MRRTRIFSLNIGISQFLELAHGKIPVNKENFFCAEFAGIFHAPSKGVFNNNVYKNQGCDPIFVRPIRGGAPIFCTRVREMLRFLSN